MTRRFAPDRMTPWRQRFVAIARELDAVAFRRRGEGLAGALPRAALPARGSLRGIRLRCVRTA